MIQRAYLFAEVVLSQVVRVDDSVDHRHSVDHDTTVAGCSDYGPQTPRDSGLRNAVTGEWSTGCGRPRLDHSPGCLARRDEHPGQFRDPLPGAPGTRAGDRERGETPAPGVIRIARSQGPEAVSSRTAEFAATHSRARSLAGTVAT